MRKSNLLPFLFLFLVAISQLRATTIRPFPNLGEMAKATETIVLAKAVRNITVDIGQSTRFQTVMEVIDPIRGSLGPHDQFAVQNYHMKIGDLERRVWGDLELEEGKTYLLFLSAIDNNLYQTTMLSYAAFEKHSRNGESVLVPFDLGREVHFHHNLGEEAPEPLAVYSTDKLLSMLHDIVRNIQIWDRNKVATNYDPSSFEIGLRGTPPGHCSFLVDNPPARWPGFETQSLPVRYHENGDSGCSTVSTKVANAIGAINSNYLGVNLSNEGIHTFVPSCSGQGATGTEFTNWINNNFGGPRNLLIQFNDPCNEIPDLMGCSGTLAVGGLYWSTPTYTAQEMEWRNAAYGYVIVNNGSGTCQCEEGTDYESMLTHELTHALNIGHIDGTGTANMNPSCCNDISDLDKQCLDFLYQPQPAPVEVVGFYGNALKNTIQLNWTSLTESNNEKYIIQKLRMEGDFATIGSVAGAGNSQGKRNYQFEDRQPQGGSNYYRLLQKDFDGTTKPVEQIAVDYYTKFDLNMRPNPVSGDFLQLETVTDVRGDLHVGIFDLTGNMLKQHKENIHKGAHHTELDMAELPAGIYILQATQNHQVKTIRFAKL